MGVRLAFAASGLRLAAAIAAAMIVSAPAARAQLFNCDNLPPLITANSGDPSVVDTVLIDLVSGERLVVTVNGNAADSRSEITPPAGPTQVIIPVGTPGPRSGSFTAQDSGLHSLLRDLFIVSPNSATMTLQCFGPSGAGSSTIDPLFLDVVINNHQSQFGNVPNNGNFFPTLGGSDPTRLRIADNNSPLPQDRAFFS